MSTMYYFYHKQSENSDEEVIAIIRETDLAAIIDAKDYAATLKPKQWMLEKVTKEVLAKQL